jgi:2-polyprenyl-3-methyl-5-hydroxy-6-metoxy-1,4-benzoquinol methylase
MGGSSSLKPGSLLRLSSYVRKSAGAVVRRWYAYRASRDRSVKNLTRMNTRQAYEAVYGGADLLAEYLGPERVRFYEEVATVCARLEPSRLIDVGCGTGDLLAAIVSRLPAIEEVVGVDHTEAGLARLSELVPTAGRICGDLFEIDLPSRPFDLVVCTEVLEHLDRPDEALLILSGLCSEDGNVLITVPDGEQDSFEGHVNFWGEEAFRDLVSRYGRADVTRIEGGRTLMALLRPGSF